MDYIIVNRSGRPLTSFHPNDLPVTPLGRFTSRTIFSFHPSSYAVFSSEDKALGYVHYMRSEITREDNRERYEEALPGSADRLERFLSTLSLKEL